MTEPPSTPPPQVTLQDDEPPDLDLLLHAVRVTLWDVAARLDPDHSGTDDLAKRARALRAVVIRLIKHRNGAA